MVVSIIFHIFALKWVSSTTAVRQSLKLWLGVRLPSFPQNKYKLKIMKPIKREKLEEIINQIVCEDPFCGLENVDKAVSDLVGYLKENNIDVE